jgi:hypothetical protein
MHERNALKPWRRSLKNQQVVAWDLPRPPLKATTRWCRPPGQCSQTARSTGPDKSPRLRLRLHPRKVLGSPLELERIGFQRKRYRPTSPDRAPRGGSARGGASVTASRRCRRRGGPSKLPLEAGARRVSPELRTNRIVGAGEKLTLLRRSRFDPLGALAEASGVLVSLARLLSPRPGEGVCWTWSGGPSCVGSISFAGSRSRS